MYFVRLAPPETITGTEKLGPQQFLHCVVGPVLAVTITVSTVNMLSVPCAPCMLHGLVHAMQHVYYTFVLVAPLQGAAQDINKSKKQKKMQKCKQMPDH